MPNVLYSVPYNLNLLVVLSVTHTFQHVHARVLSMRHMLCSQEAQDMASPAIQLSTRIPDKRLQVWAASLLAGSTMYTQLCIYMYMCICKINICTN